jgi:hypothetical protein
VRKTRVILSPVAGNSQLEPPGEAPKRRFANAGQRYELYDTTGQECIAGIVRTSDHPASRANAMTGPRPETVEIRLETQKEQ